MIKGCKICGISDPKTLTYIVDHPHPPQFVGFIVNWKASSRYVELDRLKELLNIDKKKSKYVAVVVKNDESTLEKIKDLPFDYYQMYDCSPEEIIKIKEKYNKKIIAALTIENKEDIKKYKEYENISEIILFDSKGYEKSMSFDHNLLDEVEDHTEKMIAGNIKIEDVTNFKNKHYILDVSGSLESSKGVKDINKIDKFLNTVHNISS
jgi:phosphoribosylanthranilate isomerase